MTTRALLVAAAMALVACGTSGPPAGQTVRVFLNWFPEHEHGGYYAALAGGLYRAAGLDVRILPGGPQAPVAARVASGEVEFGVLNADDVVLARAAGAPIVALLAPIQTSPLCIMVHRASGITSLRDLRDLTLASTASAVHTQFLKANVPLTNVTIIPYSGSVAEFLVNPRYAQQAYAFSEPIIAEARGGDPRCLLLADLGFSPYASTLVTRDELPRTQPALVKAMVQASAEGWRRYVEAPEPANAAILAANPEIGRDTLEQGARALTPLVRPEGSTPASVGKMTPERWRTLVEQMRSVGAIDRALDVDAMFASDAG